MNSWVYFIQAGLDGPIKIGFTSDTPERRLAQLQTSNPDQLRLLGSISGDLKKEKELHSACGAWRLQGEWFKPETAVIDLIERALAEVTNDDHVGCIHCSFCFRCQHDPELIYLFRGPAAHICCECIDTANAVIAQKRQGPK